MATADTPATTDGRGTHIHANKPQHPSPTTQYPHLTPPPAFTTTTSNLNVLHNTSLNPMTGVADTHTTAPGGTAPDAVARNTPAHGAAACVAVAQTKSAPSGIAPDAVARDTPTHKPAHSGTAPVAATRNATVHNDTLAHDARIRYNTESGEVNVQTVLPPPDPPPTTRHVHFDENDDALNEIDLTHARATLSDADFQRLREILLTHKDILAHHRTMKLP